MVKIPKIKKQHAALLIITIISILVVVTFMRSCNKTEEYNTWKVKEDLAVQGGDSVSRPDFGTFKN